MLRIGLFLLTNLSVLVLASITFRLLGLEQTLGEAGLSTNLTGLLIFCAIFGFGGALVSLLLSKWMAKMTTGTQIIDTPRSPEERWLVETVHDLARDAGIRPPQVGIFPADAANAFATGWNKNDALVAVSLGLLRRFNRDEVRAVMAHEIGHVANGDMITLSLIQGVLNTFVLFFARIIGSIVDKAIFKNEHGHGIGFFVVTIIAEIVLGLLASIVVLWFSRWREYRADAAGAHLAGRQSMINALRRLQAEVQAHVPTPLPDNMKAFGITGGFKESLAKLFASHPPLEQRIAALEQGR